MKKKIFAPLFILAGLIICAVLNSPADVWTDAQGNRWGTSDNLGSITVSNLNAANLNLSNAPTLNGGNITNLNYGGSPQSNTTYSIASGAVANLTGSVQYSGANSTLTNFAAVDSVDSSGNVNIAGYTQLQQGSYNSGVYWNGRGQVLAGNAFYAPMWSTNYTILTNCTGTVSNLAGIYLPTNSTSIIQFTIMSGVSSNAPTTAYHATLAGKFTVTQLATNVYTVKGPNYDVIDTNTLWFPGIFATATNITIGFTNSTGASTNTIRVVTQYNVCSLTSN